MEGGQTRETGRAASSRWLHFAAWLRQQAGGSPEEAVSEASASDAEEALVAAEAPAAADPATSSTQRGLAAVAREEGVSGPAPPSPVSPGQLARHATLAPRLPDCRAEMRLTSDSSSRARQEMTVMLAAPGMPLHQAPVLTAKQASALMGAICEPLLSLPVGRLTRKLSAPTRLQPTGDRGMLSLWLLPDDSLSLVWQCAQQLPATAVDECTAGTHGSGSGSSGSSSSNAASQGGSVSSRSGGSAAGLQQSCSVAMWEELAHFPAMSHLLDDAAVVTIHMLRGDTSGRSFYIRVRGDVAEANLEAATAAVPDASRLLQQQLEQRLAGVDGAPPLAPEADGGGPPRMYFWLADGDLGRAVYSLGRLKSLLKRPPSLAKRSGVPERQLAQLSAWVQRADLAAVQQQQQEEIECDAAVAAAHVQLQAERDDGDLPWGQPQVGGISSGATAPAPGCVGSGRKGAAAVPLSPLLQTPGLLLGHSMAAAAQMQQGSLAAVLPHSPGQAAAVAAAGAEGEALPSSSSTVSATAAALYQDQRFNLVCPCTISVVVTMRVQAAEADVPPESLPAEASSRARAVAERQAKAAVDRSGRQRIEERLAEVVIRSMRAQRTRARHHQRGAAARQAQAQRALALARQATGRGPSPAAGQPEAAARSEPAGMLQMHSSPFALASTASKRTDPATPAAVGSSAPMSELRRDKGGALGGSGSGRALSSPAALPTTLLPGSRVTLDNLQGLLQPQRLETSSSQGSGSSEVVHGAAAPGTAGTPPPAPDSHAAPQQVPSGRVSVADLAEVLGKQGKLE